MQLTELNAISPIDGRYRSKTISLSPYFSEEALIKYRVLIEVEYFIALREADLPQLAKIDKSIYDSLRAIYKNFSTEDALWIKETEKTTNHDVKAVEYFIKSKFDGLGLQEYKEFIHFGLTSQDINNTAIPLSTKEAFENAIAVVIALGGSTNAVLHIIAMADAIGVKICLDDFTRIGKKTPVLADLKPFGKHFMSELNATGGIQPLMKMMLEKGILNGDCITVTGKTLGENLENVKPYKNNDIIRACGNPIKENSHLTNRGVRGWVAAGT